MARRRKGPWKRKGETKDNHWYTTIGKQTIKVAEGTATYQQAYEKYVQVLADNGEVEPEQLTFKSLAKRFLNWTKLNRSPATHAFYERYLNSFVAHAGGKRVTAIMPHHVERWIDRKYSHCSSTTKNNLMKAVATAIHWGIKRRFIKHNPIAGMDKPARKPRETVLTAEQFAQLLSLVKDQEFKDYLTFVWLTGCRAMEIRIIEKRHLDGNVITLPASEAKGGKHRDITRSCG